MCLNFSVTYVGVPYIAPAYGPRCAQLPSLRLRSLGTLRLAIHGSIAAFRASMPFDPLRETSTRPPDGAADQDQKPDQKQITTLLARYEGCDRFGAPLLS